MMKSLIVILGFVLLFSCTNRGNNPAAAKSAKEGLKGAWTNGLTAGHTFLFLDDSVYYPSRNQRFHYAVKNDSIIISFPEGRFASLYQLEGDTLFMWMDYNYGAVKLWRPGVMH